MNPVLTSIAGSISVFSLLSILTNVFTILYLGPWFDRTDTIDPSDWKRKWILFFSWLNVAVFGAVVTFTLGGVLFIPFVGTAIVFIILTAVFTILYIGPTFADRESIDVDDWKRKWILFFAWFGIVTSAFGFFSSLSFSLWKDRLDNWSMRQIVIGPGRYDRVVLDGGNASAIDPEGYPAVVVNGSNARVYRGFNQRRRR